MIHALVTDFSRVLLFPADTQYAGGLNALCQNLAATGEYNFWEHFVLNRELLAFYKSVGEHVSVYMFTTEHIQEHPALQPELEGVFRGVFSGARLRLKKSDPAAYITIANEIGYSPVEVLYVDDQQHNLDAAGQAGMTTIRYTSNEQVEREINEALGRHRVVV